MKGKKEGMEEKDGIVSPQQQKSNRFSRKKTHQQITSVNIKHLSDVVNFSLLSINFHSYIARTHTAYS